MAIDVKCDQCDMLIDREGNHQHEYVIIAPDKLVCGPCFERKTKQNWKDTGKNSITTSELQALFQKPIPIQQKLF